MPYFDHNATTPLHPAARAAWLSAQDDAWQNPASGHRAGARAKALLERERERLGALLGGAAGALVFTSGATEGVNAVGWHLGTQSAAAGGIALVNPTEHSCVRAAALRWFPGRVELLALDAAGRADLEKLERRLRNGGVALVAVMAANNETGVLQPVASLADLCRRHRVPWLCDAAQWLGKLPAAALAGADYLVAAAHKFGGPKGVGLLRLPADVRDWAPGFVAGGGQQLGRRAGTEDLAGVAAMTAALGATAPKIDAGTAERLRWRAQFEAELTRVVPGARVAGAGAERLWNTVMAVLPAGENARWLTKLDKRGFAVATSAACTAEQHQASHVLAALGFSPAEARRALRFSSGWDTTDQDWHALLAALRETWSELSADGLPG